MDTERSQPTAEQQSSSALLNIDISTDTQEVAAARIREVVERKVYFKGGNGYCAWPTQLEKIENAVSSDHQQPNNPMHTDRREILG